LKVALITDQIDRADAGLKVTAIDPSGDMLDEARRMAAAEGASVTCSEADMRASDLGAAFSMVFLLAMDYAIC
jgi:hypothetical protein